MQPIVERLLQLGDGQSLVVGSDGQADVGLAGAQVDPLHARFTRQHSVLFIQDLDSRRGSFVNDREVRGLVVVRPGDRIRLGIAEFSIPGEIVDPTSPLPAASPLALTVREAINRVYIRNEQGSGVRNILDGVSFHLGAGEFLGILGASGSGKSALIKAIAGINDLSGGAILLNGHPAGSRSLRTDRRIAYLPQDVVIHEALTATMALDYIAKLKDLGDSTAERQHLVHNVLDRVGLGDRAGIPIHRLSGGQRKRVALAAELLGDPYLILLDEATSGLDPATEAEMMLLFRSLAKEGRTVVCITHFPAQLHLCDHLLYLIQGKNVFFGTPDELKQFFGVGTIEDVYSKQKELSPEKWEAAFLTSPPGQRATAAVASAPRTADHPEGSAALLTRDKFLRQTLDLTSRYFHLQIADPRNLLLLFLQAPVIGLMLAATFGSIKVPFAEQHAADTKQVIFVLVVSVLWCSGTASVREVVKEMPILQHEFRFGLQLLPYLFSKGLLLGGISLLQTFALLITVRYYTQLAGPADVQYLVLAFLAMVGVALGLLVSAFAGTSERAMTILPVLLIAQAIFSGGLARLTNWIQLFAMAFVPAYWSLDGLKSQFTSDLLNATFPGAPGSYQPPILGSAGPLVLDLLALSVHFVALMGANYLILKRKLAS